MAARPNRAERLDGFVVDDDEEEEEDWRSAMRAITKYDPTKYGNDFDDRSMVAGFSDLQAEERRSARLGRHLPPTLSRLPSAYYQAIGFIACRAWVDRNLGWF
jgi:hypothetical protein